MIITKEIFRTIILEGQELLQEVAVYNRRYELEENGKYVFVGVRQAGKSYMLFNKAKSLLNKGHSIEEIVYVNFDDERLVELKADQLDLILQAHQTICDQKPILLFDEIQNVEHWEKFARRLVNMKYTVFITGSNAKMLSSDIMSTLGGRFIDQMIFPYSFEEYIEVAGFSLSDNWQYGKEAAQIQRLLADYIKWGGFPELTLYKDKRQWLNSLYEKILLGDIVLRNKIKNVAALRLVMKKVAENVMRPVSGRRIANLISGTGVKTNTTSVIDYLQYAKEAFIIFPLTNYYSSFADRETTKKYYFIDNGLLSIFLADAETALLENICAIKLYKKYADKVYYINDDVETDFYIPDEGYAVQASYSIRDDNTREREVKGLMKLHDKHPLKRMEIVTYDEETVIDADGCQIAVVPLWKWLLM